MTRPTGIRFQLTAAFVAVAIVASAMSVLLANRGLHHELRDTARDRVAMDLAHGARMASSTWGDSGSPDSETVAELAHFAADHDLDVAVALKGGSGLARAGHDGSLEPIDSDTTSAVASAAVTIDGKRAATLYAWPSGSLLDSGQRKVSSAMDREHSLAAFIAVVFALAFALLLGKHLASPLSQVAAAADEIAEGNLQEAIPVSGPAESRSIAEALERLRAGLLEEDRLRRTGFADLAHELRAPVTNIRSRIEAAQDGVLPIEGGLAAMHAETMRLSSLLDQLSMLADAERPTALAELRPVDVAALVRQQAEVHAVGFAGAGISLDVHVEGDVGVVHGDERNLALVIRNLLSNALNYTNRGGSVTVRVLGAGDSVDVEVADTGVGIAEGDVVNVTRRFWRGEESRSRNSQGAGVGMAIVDEIVRTHGGSLAIASTLGAGTTIRISLPRTARS